MRRRDFLVAVGGAAAAWPGAARAQAKVPTIGFLALRSPSPGPFIDGLRDGLRALGYSEIKLELRSAAGVASRLPEMAAELVRLKADVIVALQTVPATAAKQATGDIPVVMAGVGDPIGTGLVVSMSRPGGNVTGTTVGGAEVAGKIVELIRDVLPSAKRFAVLANEIDPFTKPFLAATGAAARSIGMDMEPVVVRPADPLELAFQAMADKRADAMLIQGSLVRKDAFELATRQRLPSFSQSVQSPRLGGLIAYYADFAVMMREVAVYVDRILKGEKPADLPVSFPSKFVLSINLQTAQAIGVTIPPTLLVRADEVID
jgi:putative ABC transport system substrate-binding protein